MNEYIIELYPIYTHQFSSPLSACHLNVRNHSIIQYSMRDTCHLVHFFLFEIANTSIETMYSNFWPIAIIKLSKKLYLQSRQIKITRNKQTKETRMIHIAISFISLNASVRATYRLEIVRKISLALCPVLCDKKTELI